MNPETVTDFIICSVFSGKYYIWNKDQISWESGPCLLDCFTQLLQIFLVHFYITNFLFYHIPKVFHSDLVSVKATEINEIVMFMKTLYDDFCFVAWCIIMLQVDSRRWINCGHEGMHMKSSNTQIGCGFNIPHTTRRIQLISH